MPTGKIKFFQNSKGYGFISQDNGDDLFFHYSGLAKKNGRKTIKNGTRVEYEITKGLKGIQAENIREA